MNLDLDPQIAMAAGKIVRGEAAPEERFIAQCDGYYTVSWTGVAGVTQIREVPDPPSFEFTTQARDFACVLTDGQIKP